ncbi:MAG: LacI family DNA-binding transcriptional regulator, partial [Armatimonadetes bacterium]|nr:LacI family DNA-binding transcriptional regulator [Armatimonadota bacterium]
MAVSIYEVATQANVSIATVSRVLSGARGARVAPATERRVREAARHLDYHPSGVARGLARGRMNTVGLIMYYGNPSVTSDPYLGPCLEGILATHKREHQNTMLFTEGGWDDARTHLPTYCNGYCDGLLLLTPTTNTPFIEVLTKRDIPFVLIGDSREEPGVLSVDVDNVGAARESVAYLISLGHRRIAAFCGDDLFFSSAQRLAGYKRALADAGLPYDDSLVFPGSYFGSPGSGYENMQTVLSDLAINKVTAVFCFNDAIALGAMQALREAKIACPAQMSVIGFDDFAGAKSEPALTTMRQPIHEIGERAAELLINRINGLEAERALLPAQLMVRGSTAPPPGLYHRVLR